MLRKLLGHGAGRDVAVGLDAQRAGQRAQAVRSPRAAHAPVGEAGVGRADAQLARQLVAQLGAGVEQPGAGTGSAPGAA